MGKKKLLTYGIVATNFIHVLIGMSSVILLIGRELTPFKRMLLIVIFCLPIIFREYLENFFTNKMKMNKEASEQFNLIVLSGAIFISAFSLTLLLK
ncbi:hypothetical protein AB1283_01990 [Bacillus sp. S13(2024)]|uniref:hypothetical protein n=1 Tax=unclassified Bacillus (in: firmicutes) TaxID=185979 RepID=UPI003D20BB86